MARLSLSWNENANKLKKKRNDYLVPFYLETLISHVFFFQNETFIPNKNK